MNFRISRIWLLAIVGLLLLAGCGSDNNETNTAGTDPRVTEGGTATVFARFDAAVLPLPNDVAWAADGNPAVDLPVSVDDSAEMAQLKALVNAQGILGLSPNMFLTLPLTGAVDSSTLNLLIFRIDDSSLLTALFAAAQAQPPNPAAVGAALVALDYRTQNDFVIVDDVAAGVVKLLPKTPFVPGAGYAVVVKQGLMDSNGYEAVSSFTMQALKSPVSFAADSPYASFEALRTAFNDGPSALFTVVGGVTTVLGGGVLPPWGKDDILVMWTFHTADKTLSLTPTATDPAERTVSYPTDVDPFNLTTAGLKAMSGAYPTTGNALQWTNPATGEDVAGPAGVPASAALNGTGIPYDNLGNIYTGYFDSPQLSTGGTTNGIVTFRLVTPSTAGPWPVVLFQHGITSSKDAALPIANTLATAGYATLAIDALYHGDRTDPGADSGDNFFTANLIQDRANLYQAAVDLWEAVDVLAAMDTDLSGNLDTDNVEFIAHSLGSIIGSVFLSQETRVDKMVLSSPSAMLVNVLDETSLPSMQAIVGSLGYTPGTTSYYVFLNLAQWLLDPVDATYMGIGANSTDNLLALSAFADPIVSTDSTAVFLTNVGLSGTSVGVDPQAAPTSAIGGGVAGAYQYGLDPAGLGDDKPIVHSFLLSPLFDTVEDPYYTGYVQAVQTAATGLSQAQVFYFLSPP